jgi:hypothetical protein
MSVGVGVDGGVDGLGLEVGLGASEGTGEEAGGQGVVILIHTGTTEDVRERASGEAAQNMLVSWGPQEQNIWPTPQGVPCLEGLV